MLTKQFMHYLSGQTFKNIGGNDATYNWSNRSELIFSNIFGYLNFVNAYLFIEVGTGDTPANIEDYTLEEPNAVSGKLNCLSQSNMTREDCDMCAGQGIFRNDGNDDVIIKEIGLCGSKPSQTCESYNDCILFFRSILDVPVTIKPGETYLFTLRINLNSQ